MTILPKDSTSNRPADGENVTAFEKHQRKLAATMPALQ